MLVASIRDMKWQPISRIELVALIASEDAGLSVDLRDLWDNVRLEPVKWSLEPWGDQGGGFWVVAVLGQNCIWYNDIEGGFNSSRFSAFGKIDEYLCNQDDLTVALISLSARN